ncbi:MAG: hypothetical protein IRZ16_02940 [Myxococcaceae bacterium]|nr:hypothetical protein [Myxococcaceae bacterium]
MTAITSAPPPPRADWRQQLDAWSDLVNPAVVKDIRQGLRTRSFWASFALTLLASLAISVGVWLEIRDENARMNGGQAIVAYLLCVSAVQFLIVPFTGYLSLLRERNDAGWELLTLTGLGARRLLHGKLLAYCLQSALYASAAVPFLLFCYYLNGVDVLQIAAAIVLGSAWTVLLLAGAMFAGAMSFGGKIDRAVDALTTFLVLGGLAIGAPMGFGVMYGIGLVLAKHPPSFPVGLGAWTWGIVGFGMLALELAVDFLARHNERDARGSKYVPALCCIGSSVAAFIVWIVWRV